MPSARATTVVQPSKLSDLESIDLALEVAVIWGEHNVLHVEHLSPPRAFWIGEEAELQGERSDFLIGRESIGAERLPVALQTDSGIQVVVPHGASCVVEDVSGRISLEQLAVGDRLAPCPALASAVQFPLPIGATARVEHHGFAFVLKWTQAALPIARESAFEPALQSNAWTFASVGLHLGLLALFYMLPPRSAALSYDVDNERARHLQIEVIPQELPEEPTWEDPSAAQDSDNSAPVPDGQAAPQDPKRKPKPGGQDCKDCNPRRAPAAPGNPNLDDLARNGGIIQVLREMGTLRASASPYDAAHAQAGRPDILAGVFGRFDGPFGSQLGMNGTGRGAGGHAEGTIDIGMLGTSHDGGMGPGGDGTGPGGAIGTGLRDRGHIRVPVLHTGPVAVRGSLSKEVIARTIHRHSNEVRFCYEQQLIAHPDLQGRVAVKFIIAPNGSVQAAARDHGDIGSAEVERCVVEAVKRWTFPAPEGGGIVVVTYPFVFAQAGN
jgi:TonB family protein